MEESDYLTPEQKKRLDRTRAMVSLVNAINYCSTGNNKKVVTALKHAVGSSPGIVLDPRFGYTILRMLTGERISKSRRQISS